MEKHLAWKRRQQLVAKRSGAEVGKQVGAVRRASAVATRAATTDEERHIVYIRQDAGRRIARVQAKIEQYRKTGETKRRCRAEKRIQLMIKKMIDTIEGYKAHCRARTAAPPQLPPLPPRLPPLPY